MVLGGFSSPSSSDFPFGLRFLVVDHDPKSLKYLENLIKKCKYDRDSCRYEDMHPPLRKPGSLEQEKPFLFQLGRVGEPCLRQRHVTTCNLMQEALKLLQEGKEGFDLVISEFCMPDMDGIEFLQHVRLQLDIPVIMMSIHREPSREMNAVKQGACDYLVKPIRSKDLQNMWKHVVKKTVQQARYIEQLVGVQTALNESEQPDTILCKERKEDENKNHGRECCDHSSAKKPRVIWTSDLHQKFVEAVDQIGLDKAGPKKILDLMEEPGLKRENVASHLQKYRLSLNKEKGPKAQPGSVKSSDSFSQDVYFRHWRNQNSVTTENFVHAGLHFQGGTISDRNVNAGLSMPMALETSNTLLGDVIDPPITTPSGISFNESFAPHDSEVNSQQMIQNQFPWSATVSPTQFQQQFQPHYIGEASYTENAAATFSGIQNHPNFDQIASSMWTTTNHSAEQDFYDNLFNSDGFSSRVDFCEQKQKLDDFRPFNDATATNLSSPLENLANDPAYPR